MRGGGKFWGINRNEKRRSRQRESVRASESISACCEFSSIQSWFSANLRAFFPLQVVEQHILV